MCEVTFLRFHIAFKNCFEREECGDCSGLRFNLTRADSLILTSIEPSDSVLIGT